MISYVVPCWVTDEETLQLTQNAIASLKEAVPESEVILIDNGSTHGGGLMRQLADVYVRNQENLGYVPAVNQGLKLANGELIAVANNDIKVSPNWLEVAVPIFQENPDLGTLHFRMKHYTEDFTYGSGVALTGKERWCTNSFFVMRKDLPEVIGYPDEAYGKGIYDDYDYAWRIHTAGLKRAYTDKACYLHVMTHSFKKMRDEDYQAMVKKNLDYFISKWGKEPDQLFQETWPEQWAVPYSTGFKL